MIKPGDFLEPPQVMLCGLGLMADSLCCIFTLTSYRSHLHEKILYRGEPEAGEYEWVEPVAPVSTYSYVHRDAVYRTSRTHSRLPFAWLALARLADGLTAIASLGLVHSTLAEKLQFRAYWTDVTQPWFRINTAVAIRGAVELPEIHYSESARSDGFRQSGFMRRLSGIRIRCMKIMKTQDQSVRSENIQLKLYREII